MILHLQLVCLENVFEEKLITPKRQIPHLFFVGFDNFVQVFFPTWFEWTQDAFETSLTLLYIHFKYKSSNRIWFQRLCEATELVDIIQNAN